MVEPNGHEERDIALMSPIEILTNSDLGIRNIDSAYLLSQDKSQKFWHHQFLNPLVSKLQCLRIIWSITENADSWIYLQRVHFSRQQGVRSCPITRSRILSKMGLWIKFGGTLQTDFQENFIW